MAKKKAKTPLKDRIYNHLMLNAGDSYDMQYDDVLGDLIDEAAAEAGKAKVTLTITVSVPDLQKIDDEADEFCLSDGAVKSIRAAVKKARS